MNNRKKITSSSLGRKKIPSNNSSQVHIVSSGIKAKKAAGSCSGCGRKRFN